jgi:hypothetical protein
MGALLDASHHSSLLLRIKRRSYDNRQPFPRSSPSTLTSILDRPHHLGFARSFPPSHIYQVVWDAYGSSNLLQLRLHVASHMLHIMTKEECLEELPPQTRVFRQVPVSSRHQLQHNMALNTLVRVTVYFSTVSCCYLLLIPQALSFFRW